MEAVYIFVPQTACWRDTPLTIYFYLRGILYLVPENENFKKGLYIPGNVYTSKYYVAVLFCFVCHISGGGKTSLFLYILEVYFEVFFISLVLFVSFVYFVLLVNALSTSHTALQNVMHLCVVVL